MQHSEMRRKRRRIGTRARALLKFEEPTVSVFKDTSRSALQSMSWAASRRSFRLRHQKAGGGGQPPWVPGVGAPRGAIQLVLKRVMRELNLHSRPQRAGLRRAFRPRRRRGETRVQNGPRARHSRRRPPESIMNDSERSRALRRDPRESEAAPIIQRTEGVLTRACFAKL